MVNVGIELSRNITQFLFNYRSMPHAATQRTPASLALGRELRTCFARLRPTSMSEHTCDHQSRQIKNHPGNSQTSFHEGDAVMAREYRQGEKNS